MTVVLCCLDLETNGFLKEGRHIVELGYMIVEKSKTGTLTKIYETSCLIRPDGWTVECTEIHGITHEQAVNEGIPFKAALEQFAYDMRRFEVTGLMGHNICCFDIPFMKMDIAYYFCKFDMEAYDRFDTMMMARRQKYKSCKLGVLYAQLCHRPHHISAHRAIDDCRDTVAVGQVFAKTTYFTASKRSPVK